MKLLNWIRKRWHDLWYRKLHKRICARCHSPIKRGHHWTAVTWDDKRPRHWSCENPANVAPPPISTETLGAIEK